ncbi:uncharacterized protein LOC131693595 [Topomyia yanbarensis]|uniref:uncharacterized protein LOC131693595 n=1 Tax=Topomyia yanbarensis TaxID=2498891 RepID=UPI00273A7C0A|nr:uncharacterized protein LOC131693595 [Topomyia yanbarensis]
MEPLRTRRDVLFERIKWEHRNANTIVGRNPLPSELQERLQKLSELYENFDRVQSEIEEETTGLSEASSIFNYRLEFDNLYYETKEHFVRFLDEHLNRENNEAFREEQKDELKEAVRMLLESQRLMMSSQSAASTSVSQLAGQISSINPSILPAAIPVVDAGVPLEIRLPTLSIPVFNGDRKKWNSFKDLYISCIHEKRLKDSVKLQYLLSNLDGEAKKLVSAFAITDANYVQVWDKLNDFYDKKKYTVAALVKEFIEQSPISVSSLIGLRKLLSTSDEVIRQLQALGEECERRDPWLIHLLLDKLDRETRAQWAQKLVDLDNPSFAEFLTFLERRCDALETCASFSKKGYEFAKRDSEHKCGQNSKSTLSDRPIQSFSTTTQLSCPMCSQTHTIYQCTNFKEMKTNDRREFVQRAKLCFNCLKATHISKNCSSTITCKSCNQKHHSLLCSSNDQRTSDSVQQSHVPTNYKQETPTAEPEEEEVASYVARTETVCSTNFISMLPTAVVKVLGKNNVFHELRALVDSACMNSMITKQAFLRLGLNRHNASILVSGITQGKPNKTKGKVTLHISSRFDESIVIVLEALILDHLVPEQPCQEFDIDTDALIGTSLADPSYNMPGKIDLLLGIEAFFSILEPGKLVDSRNVPIAQNSIFGYLVGGRFSAVSVTTPRSGVLGLVTEVNLDKTLRQFWELEDLPKVKPLTNDERHAVEHFQTTCVRNTDGRYVVSLPFDDTKPALGDSASVAIRRFKAMERKFSIDTQYENLYKQFMAEYLSLGHMEKIPLAEVPIAADKCFYLPHHAVWKEDSTTTKLRVVFDASSKSASGVALNDRLLVGPNVNEPLFNVLARWRTYRIAFTADIEKMYR